jgi:hypothetical protein
LAQTEQPGIELLIAEALSEALERTRFGLLARNMPRFDPQKLYGRLQAALDAGKLRLALIGYACDVPSDPECFTRDVVQAVAWRNDDSTRPIVAILNPVDAPEKIHSLEMLEPFTDADLWRSIVQRGITESTGQVREFWYVLKRKDVATKLALVAEQVAQLYRSWKSGAEIYDVFPHIGLLRDPDLFAAGDAREKIIRRLRYNVDTVNNIRSLTKKDYRSLGRALSYGGPGFQETFLAIQEFMQYPNTGTLANPALSLPDVEKLFKAPKAPEPQEDSDTSSTASSQEPAAAREILDWMFSQDEERRDQLKAIADDINALFREDEQDDQAPMDWEREKQDLPPVTVITPNGREVKVTYPEKQHNLAPLMRQAVQNSVWGGVIEIDPQTLDPGLTVPQFFSDTVTLPPLRQFTPMQQISPDSLLSLFQALDQAQTEVSRESLVPLLRDLDQKRQALIPLRTRFLYLPDAGAEYLLPTSSETVLDQVAAYIEVYTQLARALQSVYRQLFTLYPDTLKQATAQFLALDTIIISRPADPRTRQSGDAVILTTMHPLYLWKWLDLSQRIRQHSELLSERETQLSEGEAKFLQAHLLRLPTVLNTFILYPAMLPRERALTYQEGDELRLILAGELDQPRSERIVGVPYYQAVSEPATPGNELSGDQLYKLLKAFLALYPPARIGIAIAVVNPPALKPLLDTCRKLAEETLLRGAHIHVFYNSHHVTLYEPRLFDDDDVIDRFRNSIHWTITTRTYQNYDEITRAVHAAFFHLTFLYNPSEAVVQPVLTTAQAQTSAFRIPLQFTYDPIRDTVRRVPAPVGGVFDVYTGLRNTMSNELSQRTYGMGRRPIKEQELRKLADQSAWLVVQDHINGTLEQPIDGALWLWQPTGTQTLTVSSQDQRWQAHLDDLLQAASIPWTRENVAQYLREVVSLLPHGLLVTVQSPSEDEEKVERSETANKDTSRHVLALIGIQHYYRIQHPHAVLIPLAALDLPETSGKTRAPAASALLAIWHEEDRIYMDVVAANLVLEQLPDLPTEAASLAALEPSARVLESLFAPQTDNTLFGPLQREILRDYLSIAVFAPREITKEDKQRIQMKAAWSEVINKLFLNYSPHIQLRSIRILMQGRPPSPQTLQSDSYHREVITLTPEIFEKPPATTVQPSAAQVVLPTEEEAEQPASTAPVSQNQANLPDNPEEPAEPDTTKEMTDQPAEETVHPVEEHLEEQAQRLRQALVAYGIAVAEVDTQKTQVGPRIIRFWVRLQPPAGRLSEVQKYIVDIARELGSKTIPLVDNIPGEQYIRIDLSREHPENVLLTDGLVELPHAQPFALEFATGVNAAGERIQHDLVRMPHLLVAGTTGSGKSVFLSGLITSLAVRHRPADLQLMLVDPKQTDFVVFDRLPHLREERVIYDSVEAITALRTILSEELEARTQLLSQARCPNNLEYNRRFPEQRIPWLVIIVDEFADIMLTLGRSERETFERQIGRLAAIGRAKGIHLVLATQRPTTDIITGTIKANIPARISFRLPSLTDSRTILDQGGAEHLLGRGDMLALIEGELQRLQGYYASYEQIDALLSTIAS